MIVAYIEAYRDRFGVEPICRVLSEHGCVIAPSTYYARRRAPISAAELEEAYLLNALVDLHRANCGVYGIRKLWHAARRAGLDVGGDQVGRLMEVAGITGAVRGRHHTDTTRSDRSAPRHPDLVSRRLGRPTGTDQLWVADFSYVWTLGGFCYVAFVVDVFSPRILGWRVATSRHTSLVLDAFRQALQVRHRGDETWTATGLVHHSDAGSQYVPWRSPPSSSTPASPARSAPSVPWTTPSASRPSDCSRPRRSTAPPGPTAETSSGRWPPALLDRTPASD